MKNFAGRYAPVQESLAAAQSVLITLPQKSKIDQVASGLALFLSLEKLGKKAVIVCAEEMKVAFSSLIGVDKIKHQLGGNNLVVSFDYVEEAVEKVSYNIDKGKFNLVIQPKEGHPPLLAEKVEYHHSGSQSDLILVIGSFSLENLGDLYQSNKDLFEKNKIINLDYHSNNSQFGKVNLVYPQAISCAEIVIDLLSKLKWPVDPDIASNLFAGLRERTQNFSSPKTTPLVFEGAAFCLRAGARRQPGDSRGVSSQKKGKGLSELKPMPTEISAEKAPGENPPPDWFEPKIFKGHTRV
jgi:nanoRNase/pAp phosphatase (c-di-AMP/oligoRNAs hydrolase)